jgi:alpha(1,3/1,4) fucosyltransferase
VLNVRLKFCETSKFHPPRLRKLFEKRFNLIEVDDDPDFIIYSVGTDFLKYRDAIRIFFTTENVRPDFNLCDYAFGFDWLTLQDRHYRCPNYQLYDEFKDIARRQRSAAGIATKTKFCNFIYTNGDAHPIRDRFFAMLSEYKRVDSAGAHLNNVGGLTPGRAYVGDWTNPKVQFQGDYKFSIAFENSSSIGYTTEKIVHALAADTIPIYWGNGEIEREFNPKRFINLHAFPRPEDAIERIIEIDANDDLFRSMLSEPFFNEGTPQYLEDDALLDAFSHIFGQPKEAAFRRNRYTWGRIYEERRIAEIDALARSVSQSSTQIATDKA